MLIIIPIGGCGQRFKDDGYIRPKPLINVLGTPMIFWLLDSLEPNIHDDDTILFIHTKELSRYNFENLVRKRYPTKNIAFVELQQQTRGTAETVYIGLKTYKQGTSDIVVMDCDTFYTCDILDICRYYEKQNMITYFKDTNPNPIYSYIDMTVENIATDDVILCIKEKVKISDNAVSGCYKFGEISYVKLYEEFITTFRGSTPELYMSVIFDYMINEYNQQVVAYKINKENIHCLGTPLQVKTFCSKQCFSNQRKQRYCFDLDNTIIYHQSSDYDDKGVVNQRVVDIIRYLKQLGHTIIIYTARRMRTHSGNVGRVIADIASLTLKSLEHHNIPYDEIYFGKPYADYYIDDLGVSMFEDLEKSLGFTMLDDAKKSRESNNLTISELTICKASYHSNTIQGEIHWYENIPEKITHLFPKFYAHTTSKNVHYESSYTIEKIDGIPVNYLYVNKSLTLEHLGLILRTLEVIHTSSEKFDISSNKVCEHYWKRIISRSLIHLSFEHYSDVISNVLGESKEEYLRIEKILYDSRHLHSVDNRRNVQMGVIHGDPVFGNILMTPDNELKFIDMRGKVANTFTIFGDVYYDWAKIYQSLIGYDNILLNKDIDYNYQQMFIEEFKRYFTYKDFEIIELITAHHLFSLIPIHLSENRNGGVEKCRKYWELCKELLKNY
jgi:capsule biosynthesis phosphatase